MCFFIVHMLDAGTNLSVWACQVDIQMESLFLERREAEIQRINHMIS